MKGRTGSHPAFSRLFLARLMARVGECPTVGTGCSTVWSHRRVAPKVASGRVASELTAVVKWLSFLLEPQSLRLSEMNTSVLRRKRLDVDHICPQVCAAL